MIENLHVNIVMVVFNQQNYVAKAIESVLMQKTNYSFKLIIGEDCSQDNTFQICKEYALKYPNQIALLKNTTNLGLIKNYTSCFQECTGKYVAILEGDDYWTDPFKLQRQIDVMEKNEDIGLVHTNYKILDENLNKISSLSQKVLEKTFQFQGYIYNKLMIQNFICAITVMFRRSIIDHMDFTPFIRNNCVTIDLAILLQCSMSYRIAFIKDEMAVYRVSPNSISNNIKFNKIEKFAETKYFIRKHYLAKQDNTELNIQLLKKSQNVFLLFKAIKTKSIPNIIKYLKAFSFSGLISCIKEWKIYN